MNTTTQPIGIACMGFLLAFSSHILLPTVACAQLTQAKQPRETVQPVPVETEMDLPNSFHKYYGQRINNWRDTERAIAKIDMDADVNYDGVINNNDPQDGGAFEATPPGLQIGVGEMSKVILRVIPYRVDFDGEVVVTLELAGINRSSPKGEFGSFDEEKANTGRIRVWREPARKNLLLDSADSQRRYVEFTSQYRVYPYNLPNEIPRVVYVEGVKASSPYIGDLRLLLTCSHRAPGSTPQSFAESRKTLLKSFRSSFDHILLTILPQPLPKELINNNAERNWIKVGAAQ
jgi:hypothetical protein|uniref:hypothetical protein n=1 Tax=Prosthecobacter sp. TaxID=1965333 RepID=UPI0037852D19